MRAQNNQLNLFGHIPNKLDFNWYNYVCSVLIVFDDNVICDRLCENRPCSHLVVIRARKHLFKKLTAFARARPLLFSRTGLSNLLNKI